MSGRAYQARRSYPLPMIRLETARGARPSRRKHVPAEPMESDEAEEARLSSTTGGQPI